MGNRITKLDVVLNPTDQPVEITINSASGEGVEAETHGGAEGEVRVGQEEAVGDEARAKVQADVIHE